MEADKYNKDVRMETKQEKTKVSKPIQNLMLTSKIPDDRDVLQKINELASVVPGIKPKDALKNFLLRNLPAEIQRLRVNGGQLIGGQS